MYAFGVPLSFIRLNPRLSDEDESGRAVFRHDAVVRQVTLMHGRCERLFNCQCVWCECFRCRPCPNAYCLLTDFFSLGLLSEMAEVSGPKRKSTSRGTLLKAFWFLPYRYIDQARGMRSDVVHNYIYNNDAVNKNIHILEKARVKRVIFECVSAPSQLRTILCAALISSHCRGTRAVGVEWVAELPPDIDSLGRRGQQVNVVRCSKMVVVSAGALGTPTILERSGIGSSDLLRKFDIEVLVDLPGVGENYMGVLYARLPYESDVNHRRIDHNGAFFPVIAADDLDSLDDMFQPDAKPSLAGMRILNLATTCSD